MANWLQADEECNFDEYWQGVWDLICEYSDDLVCDSWEGMTTWWIEDVEVAARDRAGNCYLNWRWVDGGK